MDNEKIHQSWINHLSSWIDKLPGMTLYYYFGLALLLLLIQSLGVWIDGVVPWGTILPPHIFLSAAIAFILGIIPYFDRKALLAFEKFLPISILDEEKRSEMRRKLTTLSAWRTISASLILLVVVYLLELVGSGSYRIEILEDYPVSMGISRTVYFLCWWCYGVFIYHTIHQLSLFNHIYTKHTRINIFRMKPLYGFSDLTALTAGSLILLPYGFLLVNPEVTLSDPIVLGMYAVFTLVAIITFLLPQLGIHRLQQDERDRLLDDVYQRYDFVWSELHTALDQKDYESLPKLNTACSMIEQEVATIKSISTWPWQPETVRWLFTALVLPMLMWLAQYILGRYLS